MSSSGLLRRNNRLRKEYLYRKSLEGKAAEDYEAKRRIRRALEEGKPLPTELRGDEGDRLRHEIELEDDKTAASQKLSIDDEYASASVKPPRVLITTSRDPSSRLAQFAKELKLVFPNAQRLNRGGLVVKELVESARAHDFSDIVVVHETRGEPDQMVVSHLPYGPTMYIQLAHTVTRHDIGDKRDVGTVSGAIPHLVFDGFGGKLGNRVKTIFKHLFQSPGLKGEEKKGRVVTFQANAGSDWISVRHHAYLKAGEGVAGVELKEQGPRFEARPYMIKLGTLADRHAENEYVLRSYINSAKKQRLDDGSGGKGGEE